MALTPKFAQIILFVMVAAPALYTAKCVGSEWKAYQKRKQRPIQPPPVPICYMDEQYSSIADYNRSRWTGYLYDMARYLVATKNAGDAMMGYSAFLRARGCGKGKGGLPFEAWQAMTDCLEMVGLIRQHARRCEIVIGGKEALIVLATRVREADTIVKVRAFVAKRARESGGRWDGACPNVLPPFADDGQISDHRQRIAE